ncbi:PID-CTERM protein-sorting domain-containing protein [Algibacter miyuki]|uniref:PID-CTERM protein-sorting domain-containing protein n=1 Tax=Algibacter miyuki TaxID=1306933 RepID=A0ABV5H407_9FLAO|nr:hypothetical protein [Algibacter miyuki]MDN3665666.1 hypothetical protein [Algibacter miyuki]
MISALAIVFALTFSTNMNATTAVSSVEAPTTVALASTHFTSVALTGNWYDIIFSWVKCKICGAKNCKIKHNTSNCKKCHRPHKGNCNGGGGSTPSVPLDGGLGFLMLGAAAFGVKKLRGDKKAKS